MLQETVPVSKEEDLFTHTCPSMETLFPNNPSFAKTIRDSYKYLTGVGRAFHPLPVRCVDKQPLQSAARKTFNAPKRVSTVALLFLVSFEWVLGLKPEVRSVVATHFKCFL